MAVWQRLSKVGAQPDGSIACPKCGGRQFKERRDPVTRLVLILTVAILLPLTKKNYVQCVTCGAMFRRTRYL